MSTRDPEHGSTVRVPTFDRMLWPTLEALKALGGSGSVEEIEAQVARIAGFTDEQLSVLHKDGPRHEISYRQAWARTYLGKVGAIENSARGVWSLTSSGREMTEREAAAVPRRVRRSAARTRTAERTEAPADSADESASDPEDAWTDRLLRILADIPPDGFERLCQRILRESGFTRVEVTGRSGDGGIDGIGVLRLSLVSFQVLFQCKRIRGSVGAPVIRDFRGAMTGRADKGIVITTGAFTPDAQREATRDGAPPIELIDGRQVCDLLRQYRLGVRTVEAVEIEASWFQSL